MNKIRNEEFLSPLSDGERKNINILAETFRKSGFECYLVGGSIRDLVIGRPAGDFDAATNARPDDVQKLFKRTVPTGIKHGTITVLIHDQAFEVTTYRSEGTYSDARHPDQVCFSDNLEEDLMRRDFTINALAYDPVEKYIIDCHDGLRDIENRIIRTIGRAEDRFTEDALRSVRACRFAAVLDFSLESKTRKALFDSSMHERLKMISVERFVDEIFKGLVSKKPSSMIHCLQQTGILHIFIPCPEFSSELFCEKFDFIDKTSQISSEYRWALWWIEAGFKFEAWNSMLETLKLSGKKIRDIVWFGKIIEFMNQKKNERPEPVVIRKFLSGLKKFYGSEGGMKFLETVYEYNKNSELFDAMLEIYKTDPLTVRDLEIDGKDAMQFGFHGRDVGSVLSNCLDEVLNNPKLNTKENLVKIIQTKSPSR